MKSRSYGWVKLLVFTFLFVQIILPLCALARHVAFKDVVSVFQSPQFLPMLWNSVYSTTLATAVSLVMALAATWALCRTRIHHKGVFALLFTVPMLIPSISHGMSLIMIFGDNGFFTNLTGFNIHLFGLTGIVMGATLYAFPTAFLMLSTSLQYEDYTTYEVAQVLGLTCWQRFLKISLPHMKKPLIATFFAIFTMVFTDYGVPLVVGGKMVTLPVYMYREVVGLLDISKGGVLGLVLLFPALLAFIVDLVNQEHSEIGMVGRPFVVHENHTRDRIAFLVSLLAAGVLLIPLGTFLVLCFVRQYPMDLSFSFNSLTDSFRLGVGRYLLNSLYIGFVAAFVGTIITYATAFITARSRHGFSRMALHLISLLTLSVPGIVLGLTYVLLFKGSPIYGTFAILIGVNVIHFFASPYLMAYNVLLKFNKNLEGVCSTLGITPFQLLKDVFLPSTYGTVLEMFGYIFVNCMVTISAVSFLATFRNMPLALLISRFDSQALFGPVAVISIMILVVNVVFKLLLYLLKKKLEKGVSL